MTKSFEVVVDGVIDALRTHVLPKSDDDFVRGQVFSIIFALNGLKLAADWKTGPLLEQIRLQDAAFSEVGRLADKLQHPRIPATPRAGPEVADPAQLEALRDEGDRQLGGLLLWATSESARASAPVATDEIARTLRGLIRDQLKVEIGMTPKSMLHQIATGDER
ncbi:hypothetical protein [Afipia sp. GAS231]|uniref:hypothetical protein n=1 Tax=Afipia sp. GAS231 TaxID=1882747 RepID=UPI00087BD7B7|nr:hypothetical protein [Afipia sp. GAS231]SDN40608.1 hypothetical protein SAMN05444050_1491 [Afipia sp. GAS231]